MNSTFQSILTPLSFFLSNIGNAIEVEPDAPEVKPDWQPQPMTRVLYFCESTKTYRSATYVGLWNELRGLRSEHDSKEGDHFEASPFHYECSTENMVIRARVIDDVTELGDYADISMIIPATPTNIEFAFVANMAVAS